jgi:hypothetical protein
MTKLGVTEAGIGRRLDSMDNRLSDMGNDIKEILNYVKP